MRGRNPSDPDDMAVMGLVFTIAATSDIRAKKQLVGQLLLFFFLSLTAWHLGYAKSCLFDLLILCRGGTL